MRLRNRQKPLPNGISFYDPATKYQAPPFSTFTAQVDGAIAARLANPGVTKQYNLATDRPMVEKEVDFYLAQVAMRQGWTDLVDTARQPSDGGTAPAAPFPNPAQPTRRPSPFERGVRNVVEASPIFVEFVSKEEAVPIKLASRRAEVCKDCPKNLKGGLEQFFTLLASDAIRRAYALKNEMRLETPSDQDLGMCDACGCPTRLKVWFKIETILKRLSDESRSNLHENCWIRKESNAEDV